jgi:hypothetical protein
MKSIVVIACILLSASMCRGTTYGYLPERRPLLSLREACGVGEKLLSKLGVESRFYIYGVWITGDEKGSGKGAWHLRCCSPEGDEIQISIHFPEDFCFVRPEPKDGNPQKMDTTEKGFTRDGQISEKWIEMQRNRPEPRPKVDPPRHELKAARDPKE